MAAHNILLLRKRVAGVISLNGGFGGLHPRDRQVIVAPSNRTPMTNNDKPERFRSAGAFRSILENLHFFESYEAAGHHSIQRGQEAIDLVLAINDLDHQRQVFR